MVPDDGGAAGVLVLAGTPIGNAADASPRLRELLAAADVVAAEDTRRARALAARLGVAITGRVVSCFEHNEASRTDELLDAVASGQTVLLITDAGMPAVSDPGYRLVAAAAARGLPVTCAPGPSAAITALALSGLPSDRFSFEGFPNRKPGPRARQLAALADNPRTMVYFEAPHRVAASVEAMAEVFGGERRGALCRELTKTHEEVFRGTLAELSAALRQRSNEPGGIRGEFAVVVAGAPDLEPPPLDALADQARRRRLADPTLSLKHAAAAVAAESGASKRDLYNHLLTHP